MWVTYAFENSKKLTRIEERRQLMKMDSKFAKAHKYIVIAIFLVIAGLSVLLSKNVAINLMKAPKQRSLLVLSRTSLELPVTYR